MSTLKEWIVQLRYPYTAGVIAVIWIGTALLVMMRQDAPVELLVVVSAATTIIVAIIGFSNGKR